MAGSATAKIPAVNEVARLLAALRLLRHPAAAEALFQCQANRDVVVADPLLASHLLGVRTIGEVYQAAQIASGIKRVIDVERDRGARQRAKFDKSRAKNAAVGVRVQPVGAIGCPALVVGQLK